MNPSPDFPVLLADVQTEIATLRSTLADGSPADANALAPKLKELVDALPTLSPEAGLQHKDALETLWQDLGELSADFGRIKAAAQLEMQTLNTRLKAATAYAQSSTSEKR